MGILLQRGAINITKRVPEERVAHLHQKKVRDKKI